LPLDGKPADNAAVVEAYRQWLTETEIPKLLFFGNAGVSIKEAEVAWCRENLSNLTVVDLGDAIHFVQETHPETIGTELSKWYAGI
jgi:haloalkane dehalogenase